HFAADQFSDERFLRAREIGDEALARRFGQQARNRRGAGFLIAEDKQRRVVRLAEQRQQTFTDQAPVEDETHPASADYGEISTAKVAGFFTSRNGLLFCPASAERLVVLPGRELAEDHLCCSFARSGGGGAGFCGRAAVNARAPRIDFGNRGLDRSTRVARDEAEIAVALFADDALHFRGIDGGF